MNRRTPSLIQGHIYDNQNVRVRDANSHNVLSFSNIQLSASRTRTFCISHLTSCFFASLCSRRSETAGFLLLCRSSGFVHFAGYYPAPSYPPFRAHINYRKTLQTRESVYTIMRRPCIHLATLLHRSWDDCHFGTFKSLIINLTLPDF